MNGYFFRAWWPIVDEDAAWSELCRQAEAEVPLLVAQGKAKLTGPGRFSIAPSAQVPGSGRVTESVLLYEAPAVRAPIRAYRKTVAA